MGISILTRSGQSHFRQDVRNRSKVTGLLQTPFIIMPGIVHPIADGGCGHLGIGIIVEQLQGVLPIRGLIQPLRVVVGWNDDGHPFMDGLHDASGLGRDDGAGI